MAGVGQASSLRRRVALLTGGAVALTVLVLSLVLVVGARRALTEEVDRRLVEETSVVTRFVRTAGDDEVQRVLAAADRLGGDTSQLAELLGRDRAGPSGAPATSGPPADDVPGDDRTGGDVSGRGGFDPRRGPGGPGPRERGVLDVLAGVSDSLGGATGVAQLIDATGEEVLPGLSGAVDLPVDDDDRAVAARGADGTMRFRTVEVDGRDVRLLTVGVVDGFAVQVATPLDEVRAGQARLLRTVVVVGLGGTLLAALAGLVVARRVVEPVAELRASAARVAATGDLDQHLDVQGDDELAGLAATFNDMLDSLAAARRTQRQLVADASHELRTPLTSLRTNIEVLELDRLGDDDRRELLADVGEQLVELGGLVDGLVTLARGDASAAQLVPLRLDEVVEDVVARARTNRRGVDIRLEVAPSTVLGARDEVARAVANLVDNAAKYGGEAGPVDVDVGDGVVRVRDRGPGIDPQDRARVFDRFYRAITARSRAGSGLGLAIVAQTAASHGGEVTLEHPDDGGLVAVLRLRPVSAAGS